MHVYRWDLDKTYLDTDIHSVRGLIRSALESAAQKRNVPGAPALLRALLRFDPHARVTVVSGSPTQMRAVLTEKLSLDGVRVDDLVLKDNLGNLRRGRVRAVTNQIGYKLPALLRQRAADGPGARETLFGDDAEVDALVYTLYADAVAGRLSPLDLAHHMGRGGAYDDGITAAVASLEKIPRGDAVDDIFIVLDRGTPPKAFERLGRRVVPVYAWLQAALVLGARGRLSAALTADVVRAAAADGRLDERSVVGLVQDVVRRGHLDPDVIVAMLDDPAWAALRAPVGRGLRHLGTVARRVDTTGPPDYEGFLDGLKASRA